MKVSRPVGLLVALLSVNVILMVAGRGQGADGECKAGTCLGLVFDLGGRGDRSLNDSAWQGVERARDELGVHVQYIEPPDGSDREAAVRQLAAKGLDLVIAVGFIFSEDILRLAREFPDTKFACVDFSMPQGETEVPKNVAGLRFREQEGSFLVGAIAGLKSASKTVGFVGGMDIPLIKKFEAGYRRGVQEVCPDCEVLAAYVGTTPEAWANPTAGKELAMTQYSRGADVIYHASGKSGAGVFNAARETQRWVIGVDSDQHDEAPERVLTSMLKRIDVAVFESVRGVSRGEFRSGVQEFGLAEGGVSFVYDERNEDRLPAAVIDRVQELSRRVVNGEIAVPEK